MAEGDIGAVIDSLEFDTVDGTAPDIIHVSGDVYAIAYEGVEADGWLVTVEIAANGQIGAAVIDSLEFDTVDGRQPKIIHVSGDVYAIAYSGPDGDGFVVTVDIAANGQIGAAVIDSLEFDTVDGRLPKIIHVSGDVYAIAYTGAGTDGWLVTVDIAANGQIGAAVIDSLEFDIGAASSPRIIHVSGDVYAIAYANQSIYGVVITVEIAVDGQIGAAVIDTLQFDTTRGTTTEIIHVSGDVYAIAYSGPDGDGFVVTVDIAANGQIGAAVIDSLEFDTVDGRQPKIIHVSGDVYAIAYSGPDGDGFVVTVDIAANGQIGAAVIDSLEFDTVDGRLPKIIHVSGDVYAIAYTGAGTDGWLVTVDIETLPVGGPPKHLLMMGVG